MRLGRIYSPDGNDQKYLLTRLLPPPGTPLPVSKLWSIDPPALDQGDTGTCVGNGWANFLRCEPIKTKADEATALKIYDAAILLDDITDNDNDTARQLGTTVRAGAQAVNNMHELKSYAWAFTLQPAVEWLLLQGPVVIGVNWYRSMFQPDHQGVIRIKKFSAIEGGHCVCLRGADTQKGMVRGSNSWGSGWGLQGDFLLPLRDLERLIHEQGEVCTAVEQALLPEA